jgi:hypothetical protein
LRGCGQQGRQRGRARRHLRSRADAEPAASLHASRGCLLHQVVVARAIHWLPSRIRRGYGFYPTPVTGNEAWPGLKLACL